MAKKKTKISSIKRSNQRMTKLRKQGKLKKRRHRKKERIVVKPQVRIVKKPVVNEEEEKENRLEEERQAEHLKNEFTTDSYSFLAKAQLEREVKPSRRKKRKLKAEDELKSVEYAYQQSAEPPDLKKKKYLLPIKTSEGIIPRSIEVDDEELEEDENKDDVKKAVTPDQSTEETKVYSNAELLAIRENALRQRKFRIGILCSGLLESPETKMENFKPLLEMLTEVDPEVCITTKKLSLISLLEIFKDILPGYQIKVLGDPKVKLKKHVKLLRDCETGLLKYYKSYLQNIEKLISVIKKRGKLDVTQPQINLAVMALKCLCDLLVAHPYFNYSKNIAQLIVPFLNSGTEKVRNIVSKAVVETFKTDKRGEMTLNIVRIINKQVKAKNNSVHPDMILVFLALKIKDINLDKEKEDELKKKKMDAKKHKILKTTKRERKRNKRLQALEKELLETKASENKERKQEYLTETTKLVFMVYFRILKVSPSSRLLKAALEGLAKFAHCINVEFYHDLVNVLDKLVENENLGFKEKLCCVHTVFTILHYQGATIYLDPSRFYSHLYANIIYLSAGRSHDDIPLALKALDVVLLKRRKYVSLQRLLAFTKRLSLLAMQALPNGSLALLNIIREILQLNSSTDVLLDVDSSIGQGIYDPEMNEPEYSNAGVSSLWELLPLQRHYHPTVREYAKVVAGISHTDPNHEKLTEFMGFLKMGSDDLFRHFDSSEVKFNPAVPPPKRFPKKRSVKTLINESLENYVKETLSKDDLYAEMIANP